MGAALPFFVTVVLGFLLWVLVLDFFLECTVEVCLPFTVVVVDEWWVVVWMWVECLVSTLFSVLNTFLILAKSYLEVVAWVLREDEMLPLPTKPCFIITL